MFCFDLCYAYYWLSPVPYSPLPVVDNIKPSVSILSPRIFRGSHFVFEEGHLQVRVLCTRIESPCKGQRGASVHALWACCSLAYFRRVAIIPILHVSPSLSMSLSLSLSLYTCVFPFNSLLAIDTHIHSCLCCDRACLLALTNSDCNGDSRATVSSNAVSLAVISSSFLSDSSFAFASLATWRCKEKYGQGTRGQICRNSYLTKTMRQW